MSEGTSQNVRVMVVEDEPRLRELLMHALTDWGMAVTGARSGEEALRLAGAEPPQIAVLDLNLPGMGGMECLEQLRQKSPDLQAIVLTGFGDLEAAKKAIHLNVVEFLTKPCHLGDLEVALDRARRRLPERMPTVLEEMPDSVVPPHVPSGATLDEVERQHILAALARNNGNRAATAAELGISLRTLYYRLTEYQKQGHVSE
ncbi:MAG TPA: response regulator [Tepidisphaeraceae bacterium]|jgi:two-component system response regulator RegA